MPPGSPNRARGGVWVGRGATFKKERSRGPSFPPFSARDPVLGGPPTCSQARASSRPFAPQFLSSPGPIRSPSSSPHHCPRKHFCPTPFATLRPPPLTRRAPCASTRTIPKVMQESLRHSLSEHTPFYMEKGYEEPLDVLFQLDYNVIHLDQALADRLNQVRDPAARHNRYFQ